MTMTVDRPSVRSDVDRWWLISIGAVVGAVLLSSIFAPDLISGSEQEHLPLASFTDWLWGGVAIGYLSFARRGVLDATTGLAVVTLWAAVALTSIFAPSFVTGADPTSIPLAALMAPVVGAISTGFVALHACGRQDRP
jgi:hypothetical protein